MQWLSATFVTVRNRRFSADAIGLAEHPAGHPTPLPFNISNKNIARSPKTAAVAQRKKNVVVERQEKKIPSEASNHVFYTTHTDLEGL